MKKLLILIIPLLLTGCDGTDCNEGKVTGKFYKEPYTTFVSNGKFIIPVHHAEKWKIELNSECTFEVSKEEFKKINVGDEISPDKGDNNDY